MSGKSLCVVDIIPAKCGVEFESEGLITQPTSPVHFRAIANVDGKRLYSEWTRWFGRSECPVVLRWSDFVWLDN